MPLAGKLATHKNQRILHVSGQFPAAQACTGLMLPLMPHPLIKTRTLAVELRPEALKLIEYTAEQIEQNIFTKHSQMPEGETRIGLKEIHHNRCPILFEPDDAKALGLKLDMAHLGIDIQQAREIHAQLNASSESIMHKLAKVFAKQREFDNADPDGALYSGFFDRVDKAKFSKARASQGQAALVFNDARLSELYFRYKARNWPESLDTGERMLWQQAPERTFERGNPAGLCGAMRCADRFEPPAHRSFTGFEGLGRTYLRVTVVHELSALSAEC